MPENLHHDLHDCRAGQREFVIQVTEVGPKPSSCLDDESLGNDPSAFVNLVARMIIVIHN